MRILYITDGRSPIALNWIGYFINSEHEVHLISTFPSPPIAGLASMCIIPVGMSDLYGSVGTAGSKRWRLLRRVIPVNLRTRVRQIFAPLTFYRAASSIRKAIEQIQPDLIHAMRIPYEGMVASMAIETQRPTENNRRFPLLISVWGNDFTLHARSSSVMANHTRRTLQNCTALHADCQRDLGEAKELGFATSKPNILLPGGGGVKTSIFYPPKIQRKVDGGPVMIINPRGFRAYVQNDTFFQAIPLVIKEDENVHFLCPGMAGEPLAKDWVNSLKIAGWVDLLPAITQNEMAELFRQSQISLSITTHDGTPNTLLEAMACGCFPIAGDIEALREWIAPGVNGLLVDPMDPEALASAILDVLGRPDLQAEAKDRNLQMVMERAEYEVTMKAAEEFYKRIIEN